MQSDHVVKEEILNFIPPTVSLFVLYDQCDQIIRLFVYYLATYNTENLPKTQQICQSRLNLLPNNK